jgi:hypothetical protein
MNIFKYAFIISILTISCNACGMLALNNKHIAKKEAELTALFLQHTTGKNQDRAFELLGKGDMRTKPENRELVAIARSAYKCRRGLRQQKENRAALNSSDPHRRRTF